MRRIYTDPENQQQTEFVETVEKRITTTMNLDRYHWGDGINHHVHDYSQGSVKPITSTRKQRIIIVEGVSEYTHQVSLAKRQSEELYSICEPIGGGVSILPTSSNAQKDTQGQMQKLIEFHLGTEQLGFAERRQENYSTAIGKLP